MKRFLAIIAILLCGISVTNGQTKSDQEVIVGGRLDSGISYYIVKTPKQTVDYVLIQNTGSSLERADEDGLAHFIEHLSFLSTDHFPESVSTFCKRHNIQNNASTYQDKIIYYASGVDCKDLALNDSCLNILYDWCGHLTLDPEQVAQEKKVIMEEWRTRRQPTPIDLELAAAVFNYTKLGNLGGLGDMDRLMSYSNEELKRFCDGWFTPTQTAIMVSGDVDIKSVEAKIKELFSDIKQAPNYVERVPIVIPDNDSTIFRTMQVNGISGNNILIYSRINTPIATTRDQHIKELIYAKLYNTFVEQRLARYREDQASDIATASVVYEPFMRGKQRLQITVIPKRGRDKIAMERVVGIHYDMLNNGLTESEIADMRVGCDYHFGVDSESCDYKQIVEYNFIRGEQLYTSTDFNRTLTEVIKEFDNEEFARFCRDRIRFDNIVCFVCVGEQAGKPIDQQTFLAIVNDKEASFGFDPAPDFSFDKELKGDAKIVSEAKVDAFGSDLLTLSNGVKVLMRKGDDHRVTLRAVSKGGTSALEFQDINMGRALPVMVAASGAGGNSKQTLDRLRFTHDLSMELIVNECDERITASAPTASAERLLELLYLQLEHPDFDMGIIGKRSRIEPLLVEKIKPTEEYKAMLMTEVYGRDLRKLSFGDSFFNTMDKEEVERVFDAKFRNPDQWFFIVEGDVSKDLLVKYLGALTAGGESDKYTQRRAQKIKKSVTREIIYNTPDNNGGTDMSFVYSKPLIGNDMADFTVMAAVIRNRVNEEFRDQRAAIYGMFSDSYAQILPDNMAVVNLNFGSKKEDQQPLAEFIEAEVKRVAKEGISESDLIAAKARIDAEQFGDYEAFDGVFNCYLQDKPVEKIAPADLNKSTVESVQKFTKKFSKDAKIVRFVFK